MIQTFISFSIWLRVLATDFATAFHLTLPYQQQIVFGVLMFLPALFLLIFNSMHHINRDLWIQRYITDWDKTKKKISAVVLLSMVLWCLVVLLADQASFQAVVNNHQPPTSSAWSAMLVGVGILLVGWLTWRWVIAVFRRHRLQDRSANHSKFFEWWLNVIFQCRRFTLFLLTILFMPVARVILLQFQCVCLSDLVNANSLASVSHPVLLSSSSSLSRSPPSSFHHFMLTSNSTNTNTTSTSSSLSCYLKPFPDQACLPDAWSILQVVAGFFALVYIIGVPLFFMYLIRNGVHQMIDIHGYQDEKDKMKEKIEFLKQSKVGVRILSLTIHPSFITHSSFIHHSPVVDSIITAGPKSTQADQAIREGIGCLLFQQSRDKSSPTNLFVCSFPKKISILQAVSNASKALDYHCQCLYQKLDLRSISGLSHGSCIVVFHAAFHVV